jgi:hypothetical protein
VINETRKEYLEGKSAFDVIGEFIRDSFVKLELVKTGLKDPGSGRGRYVCEHFESELRIDLAGTNELV